MPYLILQQLNLCSSKIPLRLSILQTNTINTLGLLLQLLALLPLQFISMFSLNISSGFGLLLIATGLLLFEQSLLFLVRELLLWYLSLCDLLFAIQFNYSGG